MSDHIRQEVHWPPKTTKSEFFDFRHVTKLDEHFSIEFCDKINEMIYKFLIINRV